MGGRASWNRDGRGGGTRDAAAEPKIRAVEAVAGFLREVPGAGADCFCDSAGVIPSRGAETASRRRMRQLIGYQALSVVCPPILSGLELPFHHIPPFVPLWPTNGSARLNSDEAPNSGLRVHRNSCRFAFG